MGVYHVTLRYDDDTTNEHTVHALTFDEAWDRFSTNKNVVGATIASVKDPENYTVYGLGA